jgi:CheY-like chemotaxis protein
MEQGGTLAVGTAATTGDVEPHGVRVTVSDTGTGMAPETLERIFEPFYTTKEVGKGSGLGLAQVWGFVTQSGGRIGVDSALGKGTTFSLSLPLTEMAPPVAPQAETAPRLEHGAETILVVEDDNDVRAMTAATLQELGYKTVIAQDGPQALAALGTGEPVDLLFSDYVMPGMSGAELARAAHAQRPELKILLTSGYAKHAELRDGNSADGFPLLPKPYRADELAAKIREVLEQRDAQATAQG